MKIYVDTVTKELVLENGIEYRYPAYSEIQRQKWGDYIVIRTVSNVPILDKTIYSDLQNEAGTAYVSFAALKLALDSYFDSTL
tara:strand:+ start:2706 stop:2954 length:249 start_codon:yes stop_codon:yes gene_type:complete